MNYPVNPVHPVYFPILVGIEVSGKPLNLSTEEYSHGDHEDTEKKQGENSGILHHPSKVLYTFSRSHIPRHPVIQRDCESITESLKEESTTENGSAFFKTRSPRLRVKLWVDK